MKSMFSMLFAVAALVGPPAVTMAADNDASLRFEGVERVIAFGDVHGAYDELVALLKGVGVVDDELRWSGGELHLVSTGDLVDRGDYGRQVLELLMRLQQEAEAAGGAVHVLLGNHEVMNLTGDLRYVSPGDTEQFGGADARAAAFAPDGGLGAWLLRQPALIVVNDTAFVHGGLSETLAGMSLAEIDRHFRDALAATLAAPPEPPARPTGLPFDADGPVWYRGSSLCHAYVEGETVEAVLTGIDAKRVAVGHTGTPDHRITSRLDGRVLRMDTGMNPKFYSGIPAALVIEGDSTRAWYLGEGYREVVAEPSRLGTRPHGLDDAGIEDFLQRATVVGSEDLGIGVTRPQRLTLELDGRRMRALFKTVDTDPGLPERRWTRAAENADRYQYDVAAYRLDRLLGFDMTPVSVLREIDGQHGALTYWLEDAFNENQRRERSLPFRGHCALPPQYALMNVFDVLIYNVDRSLGNIVYDEDWRLWLIDHSRAFRTRRGIPAMARDAQFTITPELDRALARVTPENLRPLAELLHPRQIEALVARARSLREHR